jgi:hypothetical protein
MVAPKRGSHVGQATEKTDRQVRIEKMKSEVRTLCGGQMVASEDEENGNSEVAEAFWQHVLAFESGPNGTRFGQLQSEGVELPAADSLDDVMLHRKLWEVIRKLADLGVYLYHTDHLSDRELYTILWGDLLRQEDVILPPHPHSACHLDILGGCSEEDIMLNHKYYADDLDREMWRLDFPNDPIPDHEDPPYDRDLPRWAFG